MEEDPDIASVASYTPTASHIGMCMPIPRQVASDVLKVIIENRCIERMEGPFGGGWAMHSYAGYERQLIDPDFTLAHLASLQYHREFPGALWYDADHGMQLKPLRHERPIPMKVGETHWHEVLNPDFDDTTPLRMVTNRHGLLTIYRFLRWDQGEPGADTEGEDCEDEAHHVHLRHRPLQVALAHRYMPHGEAVDILSLDTGVGCSTIYDAAGAWVPWACDPNLRVRDHQGRVLPQHGPLKTVKALSELQTVLYNVTLPVLGGGKRAAPDMDVPIRMYCSDCGSRSSTLHNGLCNTCDGRECLQCHILNPPLRFGLCIGCRGTGIGGSGLSQAPMEMDDGAGVMEAPPPSAQSAAVAEDAATPEVTNPHATATATAEATAPPTTATTEATTVATAAATTSTTLTPEQQARIKANRLEAEKRRAKASAATVNHFDDAEFDFFDAAAEMQYTEASIPHAAAASTAPDTTPESGTTKDPAADADELTRLEKLYATMFFTTQEAQQVFDTLEVERIRLKELVDVMVINHVANCNDIFDILLLPAKGNEVSLADAKQALLRMKLLLHSDHNKQYTDGITSGELLSKVSDAYEQVRMELSCGVSPQCLSSAARAVLDTIAQSLACIRQRDAQSKLLEDLKAKTARCRNDCEVLRKTMQRSPVSTPRATSSPDASDSASGGSPSAQASSHTAPQAPGCPSVPAAPSSTSHKARLVYKGYKGFWRGG